MSAPLGHRHEWRTRRRTVLRDPDEPEIVTRFAHDMTCDCGAQLTQPDIDHPEPDDHDFTASSIRDHCHYVEAEWRCDCGAQLREAPSRIPGSDDFYEHADPRCQDCNHLKALAPEPRFP